MLEDLANARLARNFHRTFVPERQYLNALLKFAAQEKSGDIQKISEMTGIPTGKSSGKVGPTIDYCRGMGLIKLASDSSSVKIPLLTEFGRSVLINDPFFLDPLTQWIAHLHLCDSISGADIWFYTFCEGAVRFGNRFSRDELNEWLQSQFNLYQGNLIGPMVRMYEDAASFSACGAISEENDIISRKSAPTDNLYAAAYGAWLVSLIERSSKSGAQVSQPDLNRITGWQSIGGWNNGEAAKVLQHIEEAELISVDRHMKPWIIKPLVKSGEIWKSIYDELI